jgi:prepilin peptidase CpaA
MWTELAPQMLAGAVFVSLLASACVGDVRSRRIPNTLVLCIAVLGTSYSLALEPSRYGALRALGGMGVGLVFWLPSYVVRKLGAGDVKFFAAASAWLGPATALEAALLSALFGGFLGLAWLARDSGWIRRLSRRSVAVRQPESVPELSATDRRHRLPYGLAMAAGLAVAAWLPGLLR